MCRLNGGDMDLRVQKTQRSIINAFIELRSKKNLEKITVKELAERAEINKATFYQHYKDIYDLSEQLEEEAIENAIRSIPHPENIIKNSREGFLHIVSAIMSQSQLFRILFSGTRNHLLIEKLEKELKQLIFEVYPEYRDNLEKDLLLTVLIQGSFHAVFTHQEHGFDEVIDVLCNINECLLSNYPMDRK